MVWLRSFSCSYGKHTCVASKRHRAVPFVIVRRLPSAIRIPYSRILRDAISNYRSSGGSSLLDECYELVVHSGGSWVGDSAGMATKRRPMEKQPSHNALDRRIHL